MSPRKVLGRDGTRVLVDLDRQRRGVRLGATVDGDSVSPALPVDAFIEAGLFDEAVDDPEAVLAKLGQPPDGLP